MLYAQMTIHCDVPLTTLPPTSAVTTSPRPSPGPGPSPSPSTGPAPALPQS